MEAPPKAGPGASVEAWAEFAGSLGIVVDAGWSRSELIAAVEAVGDAGVVAEPEVEAAVPEPEVVPAAGPEPASGVVRFESRARRKRVYRADGTVLCSFVPGDRFGVFETADSEVVAVLDGLPDVRRAD